MRNSRHIFTQSTVTIAGCQAIACLLAIGSVAARGDRIAGPLIPQWLAWSAKVLTFPLFYVLPDAVIEIAFPIGVLVTAGLNGGMWAAAIGFVRKLLQRQPTTSAS